MFKVKFALIILLLAATVLMSGCSLMYYSDSEDGMGGDPPVSSDSSENISDDLPTNPEALFRDTVTISYNRLMEINAGMTCGEVVEILGETQSFGRPGYRQYVTEDGRLIQFRFDGNNDGCLYSGMVLDNNAVPLNYSRELSEGTVYGVLVNYGGFVTFGTGEADGAELLTDDAEIVFEDGSAATKYSLKPGMPLLISRDKIIPGTIEQWHCTKIVILPVKSKYTDIFNAIPVNTPYGELLEILEDLESSGELETFGLTGYARYVTGDDHLIPLRFDSPDDLCLYSGAELYRLSFPLHYNGRVPEGMTYGVLSEVGGEMMFTYFYVIDNDSGVDILRYCLNTVYLAADGAEIVFGDGAPASEDDFSPETMVFVQYDDLTDPGEPWKKHCTKIVILPENAVYAYYSDPEDYQWVTEITTERLSDIPANTSYGDILKKLGRIAAFGYSCYRQYVTDDDRIIQLHFESKDELCPYSGAELYERAMPLEYDGEKPEGMSYGLLAGDGKFFTYYMEYYNTIEEKMDIYTDAEGNRVITGVNLRTHDAEITFGDGTPASEDDLKPETAVFIQSDYTLASYPGQMHCTKIVILK